jgi:UDP-N-acetylmuramyl pentapeptide phosphotransferase/UDP-N-acetylglucosamine-1-phosphate transferase
MKERLKNPITTVVGVIIIIAALLFIWFGKSDIVNSLPLLAAGAALLGSRDDLFINNFFPNKDKSSETE